MLNNGGGDIMATKSFTDTYVIRKKDVDRFHNIMNSEKKVKHFMHEKPYRRRLESLKKVSAALEFVLCFFLSNVFWYEKEKYCKI